MYNLRIAEIFSSIQGEGIWAGTPSIFIRVSGCNLRCVWCDTPYASWNPEGPIRHSDDIASEAIDSPIKHVVLTGGEPMLFAGIEPLASSLHKAGKTITIETAGTVYRNLPCDLMSISPKLSHSTPIGTDWQDRHENKRWNPQVVLSLLKTYRSQLKFVVRGDCLEEDMAEIRLLLEQLSPAADSVPILLMPEGIDAESLHRQEKLLVPIALREGFRLSPRLHIDLFGNTRGT